jgi:hypothetical protein
MNGTAKEREARLRQLVADRAHVYDEDFRLACLSKRKEAKLLQEMSDVGYEIGRTEDNQNEWWPPEKGNEDDH